MLSMFKKCLMVVVVAFIFVVCVGVSNNPTPYTIMIYMNGSDLESEFGLATGDLVEMLDSGIISKNANVIIFTGGAEVWQNDAIPDNECIIWQLDDGWLNEIKSMGNVNMGNPNTLRDFITFSMKNYPAQKYGLIMWNHGGGSIAGFGHDENFSDGSLTLGDMQKAFEESGLRKQKLEFLGFDACLMASIEMAIIASDYAHVLIASEDLEPGDGWDYNFLSVLNINPNISGLNLGKVIVDTFMDFYGEDSDEILSLSVVDLSKVAPVMDAMGELMTVALNSLNSSNSLKSHINHSTLATVADHRNPTFTDLAIRRTNTKTFGEGSPRDNYSDMVDIGDMAYQLADLFPREAANVLRALANCVTYNRHNAIVELHGLSTFYIYGGKSQGEPSLRIYSNLNMDQYYTKYLHQFFEHLKESQGRNIRKTELVLLKKTVTNTTAEKQIYRMAGLLQTSDAGDYLWPTLEGYHITMFPTTTTANSRLYAIPVKINENDADIVICFTAKQPQGKILGVRHYSGKVIQKGYFPIYQGDEIAIYSLEWNPATRQETWHLNPSFTVGDTLTLSWEVAPNDYLLGYRYTDICCNVTYSF